MPNLVPDGGQVCLGKEVAAQERRELPDSSGQVPTQSNASKSMTLGTGRCASAGGDICCRSFYIVEVDPEAKAVWEVEHTSPGKSYQYRVYPSDSVMGEVRIADR